MADARIAVQIIGDSSSLERAFRRAGTEAQTFSHRLGSAVAGIAKTTAFAAGTAAIGGLALVIHEGIKETKELQSVQAQTAAVLKSTGASANISAKQVRAMSLELSNLSGIDDETIQGGENLLLSFRNIRNEVGKGNDIFNQATKAVVDFASRTGKDIPTAAVLLGRALEDPAGKIAALSRAGIVFTKSQRDVVAAVQKTSGVMAAQKLLLQELEIRFGGAGAAAGKTLPGQLNILRERFKDLSGVIVGAAVPIVSQLVPAVTKLVVQLQAWLEKTQNQKKIQQDANTIFKDAKSIIQGLADVLVPLAKTAKDVADQVGGLRTAVKLLAAAFIAVKVTSFASAIGGVGTQAAGSAVQVNALRLAMLRLGAIGVITLGVEVLLNKDTIDKSVKNFLRGHDLGFLAGTQLKIPAHVDLTQLEATRKKIASVKGENDLLVKSLDAMIARLKAAKFTGTGSSGADNLKGGRARSAASPVAGGSQGIAKVVDPLDALSKKFADTAKKSSDSTKKAADATKSQAAAAEAVRKAAEAAKAAAQAAAQRFKDARDRAASLFGQLFQAPGGAPTAETVFLGGSRGATAKTIGGPDTAKQLLGNLQAQIQSFKTLEGAIGRLAARGAPQALLSAARSGEIPADQIEALAAANSKTLAKVFRDVSLSQKLINQAAKTEIQSKNTIINAGTVKLQGVHAIPGGGFAPEPDIVIHNKILLDGKQIEQSTVRRSKKRANQRRGRVGGTR